MRMAIAASGVLLLGASGAWPVSADPGPASPVLREWSPCLSGLAVSLREGAGPWRLVGAVLEADSAAPLCGDVPLCGDGPLSGGGGSLIFRFFDENGARLCPPEVRGRVSGAGVDAALEPCELTPEGPIQRFSLLGTGYDACAGPAAARGGFTATVDAASNDGLASDAVTGLGLPNGRPVNIVLTWQRRPPPAPRALFVPGFCNVKITTSCPLPAGTVGQSYSAALTASGGGGFGGTFAGVVWQISPPGALPQGLALSTLGTNSSITGTPAGAGGTFQFTLTAADLSDPTCTDSVQCSITISGGSTTGGGGGTAPPQYGTSGNNQRAAYVQGGPDDSSSSSSGGGGGGCFAASTPLGALLPLAAPVVMAAALRSRRRGTRGRRPETARSAVPGRGGREVISG